MNSGGPTCQRRRRKGAGVWCSLLIATVFGLYIHYIPFHLAIEPHWHDFLLPLESAHSGLDRPHDPNHEGHHQHHMPHPDSEHAIQMFLKSESLLIGLAVLRATGRLLPELPTQSTTIPSLAERIWLPGESPPDPLRPRGPPAS